MGIFKAYDIRGVYGRELNEELAYKVGRAMATYLDAATLVVGNDMRPHSIPLKAALIRGMTDQGADVLDIGLCSTPMSYHANGHMGADGSVMVTASHNPHQWNGFKLCRRQVIPLSADSGIREIEQLVLADSWQIPDSPGACRSVDVTQSYREMVTRRITFVHKPRIVVDYANGMGSVEIAGIRDRFELIELYKELDGSFPNHEANPLKHDTLEVLRQRVIEEQAEFGVAFDGDADRCGFVDELGQIVTMDHSTALIAQGILSAGPANIVYDLRSSWSVPEHIKRYGGTPLMSRVGHAFIKNQMREQGAVFGGELAGHYYFQENFTAESMALALVMVANMLEESGQTLSEMVRPLRKYHSTGEINFQVENIQEILHEVRARYSDGHLFELDGISVEYDDWWFNLRASNTEPLLRLIVEARTPEMVKQKRAELLGLIRG